jgi:hypothetical protein
MVASEEEVAWGGVNLACIGTVGNPYLARFSHKEPSLRQVAQHAEGICLPGSAGRAGATARATALSSLTGFFFLFQPRPCAGEAAVTNHKSVLQTGTTRPRGVSARIGVTSDGAEYPPRLRVANGEDSQESKPPVKRRVKTHMASPQDNSPPVPWRWSSRGARIKGLIDRRIERPAETTVTSEWVDSMEIVRLSVVPLPP